MAEELKSDEQLIEAFRNSKSEEAFREIVAKYLGMVYGIARRKTQDHFVAEEISQNVFSALARKASGLRGTPTLAGWLYRCTAIECAAFHRHNHVRQKAMKTLADDARANPEEEPQWKEILPVLDDAIAELPPGDRDLLLMRFFEGKRFSEIADALGKSAVATQKQGERALTKLARILQRKGVTAPVSVLCAGLASQLSPAAPAGLAFTISKGALAGVSSLSAKTLILESLNIMAHSKLKATAVALALALPLGVAWKSNQNLKDELASVRDQMAEMASQAPLGPEPSRRAMAPLRGQRRPAPAPVVSAPSDEIVSNPDAALEQALLESDPLRRMERFARLLANLTAQDAPLLAEKFETMRRRGAAFPSEFRLFLRAWGKLDGLAAVEHARQVSTQTRGGLTKENLASAEMISALAGWSSAAPIAAQSWLDGVPEGKEKEHLIYGLLDGWSMSDLRGAAAYAESRPRSEARDRFRQLLMERALSTGGVAAAQQWVEQIPNDEHNELYKQRAFDEVVRSMLYRDPAAAAKWIQQHQSDQFVTEGSIQATARKLAETAPMEAFDWLKSLQESKPDSIGSGLSAVVGEWAAKDPVAAGQWLVANSNDANYDKMAGVYAGKLAGNDTSAAVQWANSVRDTDNRSTALDRVAREVLGVQGEINGAAELRAAGYSDEMIERAERSSQAIFLTPWSASQDEGAFSVAMATPRDIVVTDALAGEITASYGYSVDLVNGEHVKAGSSRNSAEARLSRQPKVLDASSNTSNSEFADLKRSELRALESAVLVENQSAGAERSATTEIQVLQSPPSDADFLNGFLRAHGVEGASLNCAQCHR